MLVLTGFGAGRRRRLRPLCPKEPKDPKDPLDLCEKAEAKELPLECEVPKLEVEETLQSDRLDPSSV